jgi:SAM-dependent methyltransferase
MREMHRVPRTPLNMSAKLSIAVFLCMLMTPKLDDALAAFKTPLYPFDVTGPFGGIYATEPGYDVKQKAGVTSQFVDDAAMYHAKYANYDRWKWLLKKALDQLALPDTPALVLDVGSGSGNSVLPMLELLPGCRVVATDISPNLLMILRDALAEREYLDRCLLVSGDLTEVRFTEGAFDLAVGAAILHHVIDPAPVVEACLQALKPGGAAIFYEPFEAGNVILRIAYEQILSRTDEFPLSADAARVLAAFCRDYEVRSGSDKTGAIFREIDDKWLFTKSYFEEIARQVGASVTIFPLHESDQQFRKQTVTNLRLTLGSEDALPPAAWEVIDYFDNVFSPEFKRELVIEGCIIFSLPTR